MSTTPTPTPIAAQAGSERHHPKCRLHGVKTDPWNRHPPCNCPDTWEEVVFSRTYPGLWKSRLLPGNHNPREVAFARQWMEENAPERRSHLLDVLLDSRPQDSAGFKTGIHPKATERDKLVASTLIQWLGSNIGMSFLGSAIRRSPEAIRYMKAELIGYNDDGSKRGSPNTKASDGAPKA